MSARTINTLRALCRRLHCRFTRRNLQQQQRDLRGQLAATQLELDEATREALRLSRLHRFSPALQQQRQGLRAERDALEQRLKTVGQKLSKELS